MDINVAHTFLEVVKTGSFVNAAANLNLTQTAVSARIRSLEEQLGRPVFVRNKAGSRLTPAGERFFRFATTLVQVWDRAKQSVALPPGRDSIVVIGAEISLWSPLLRHWLIWMRRECPDVAIRVVIDNAERLMEQVQEGSMDIAILYGAPRRQGIIAELLFEEQLVMARTTPTEHPLNVDDHVLVDWGEDFLSSYDAAFPDEQNPVLSVSYGPLALDYILATGGSGYFRKGFIRPYLEEGRLAIVPDSPEFAYSAYAVYSTKADQGVMERALSGLRTTARIAS
ncbi:LysR family transcriptional regulator [Emcibacter sp.]|uniref:LysR family transcriptional regulator n=1 Tax=Emcibacter sp. TaxID=1979954 RepID=UPI003A8D9195